MTEHARRAIAAVLNAVLDENPGTTLALTGDPDDVLLVAFTVPESETVPPPAPPAGGGA